MPQFEYEPPKIGSRAWHAQEARRRRYENRSIPSGYSGVISEMISGIASAVGMMIIIILMIALVVFTFIPVVGGLLVVMDVVLLLVINAIFGKRQAINPPKPAPSSEEIWRKWLEEPKEEKDARSALESVQAEQERFDEAISTSVLEVGDNHSITLEKLLALSPLQFEDVVMNLFRGLGFDVRSTERVGDGGIDCLFVDDRPLVGAGKVLVQAKRFQGTVGSPVIRDLYGAVTHERAGKGIVITTGTFSRAAVKFAAGKPIELIDGSTLVNLLNKARNRSETATEEHQIAES
jgi:hypothetical protein